MPQWLYDSCMNFIYPAIIKKTENGYEARFPDLEMCEAKGRTINDCLEDARDAMENWLRAEFEEEDPLFPTMSAPEDIELSENEEVRNILVIYRLTDGYDE